MVESCEVINEQSGSLPLFILTVCQEHRFKDHNVSTALEKNNQVSVFFHCHPKYPRRVLVLNGSLISQPTVTDATQKSTIVKVRTWIYSDDFDCKEREFFSS